MKMWFLFFTLLPLAGLVYIGWHVWTLLPLHWIWKFLVILLGFSCFGLLFLNFKGKLDTFPLVVSQVLYEIGTSSLFVMLYLVMLFLVLDLGRFCRIIPRSILYGNWYTTAGIFVVLLSIFIYGNYHYKQKVRVPLEVKTAKPLPKAYKVVMLSDLHLGYHNPRKELARWVNLINDEHPDFILVAGDIIDISVRPLIEEDMAAEFRRLHAPIYACLGNHEYYSGESQAQKFYQDADIHLLSDTFIKIDSALVIIGREDRTNLRRKSVKDLVVQVDTTLFTILLDHQPYDLEQSEQAHVDFQLSGHTHRGQVWPISWITDAIYECSWGSHQRTGTQYYVSSGIGIWGGKFRIGTQSEYVVATIQSMSEP
ncbi:MAG: metallophosphoesterase [Bacteroidaceae bacterium]|nr:metallophosphoesterase [Bacteroidaceae bacterium]